MSKLETNDQYTQKMKDFDGEMDLDDDASSIKSDATNVDDEENDCDQVKKKLAHLKSILKK